jgi:hypothetical protein
MIIPNPAIMMSQRKPRTTIPFDHKSGSKIEAKKALMKNRKGNGNIRNVDSMKKVTQCIAIRNPTNVNVKRL